MDAVRDFFSNLSDQLLRRLLINSINHTNRIHYTPLASHHLALLSLSNSLSLPPNLHAQLWALHVTETTRRTRFTTSLHRLDTLTFEEVRSFDTELDREITRLHTSCANTLDVLRRGSEYTARKRLTRL